MWKFENACPVEQPDGKCEGPVRNEGSVRPRINNKTAYKIKEMPFKEISFIFSK
jgi:hypothetical protein